VTLRDGTRITLAPRTTLRLEHFGPQSRTVQLEGAAYFEIPHTVGTPFLVQSGSVVTRVLGTSFLVRDYPGERYMRVAVSTGKVVIASSASRFSAVTLVAGDIGDVADSTIVTKRASSDEVASETGWMHGRLLFHNAPVPEILAALNRWYGYEFRCADTSVMRKDLTIALSAQSSSSALAVLKQVLNVNLTVVGDTVSLTPKRFLPTHGTRRTQGYDVWMPIKEAGL
jgi:ferric-dicitrate binding protein FerR (iron transport regulator)